MPTIHDIAKKAGVSVGTVSNYLNNPEIVNEKTRKTIQDAIDDLGYHPHSAARSLKTKQTNRIGFVPLISVEENRNLGSGDNVFLDFLAAVNTIAADRGYSILLNAATTREDELRIYKRIVGEKQVDGLIVMGTRSKDERIQFLLDQSFPFVSFGRTKDKRKYPFVDIDGAKGISDAVDHLVKLGHRRIGYIKLPDDLMCAQYRWEGFTSSMKAHGLDIDPEIVVEGGFTEDAGQIAMHLLLDKDQAPTAVLAPNDLSAFGAMRAAQSRGLQPGEDVSIVGFDNIRLSSHWYPTLTTISQPVREIGFAVTRKLIDVIKGKKVTYQEIIAPELITRQSTGEVKEKEKIIG